MNGLKKKWYIDTMDLYSVTEENEIMLLAGK
jgi:hypothetical protein